MVHVETIVCVVRWYSAGSFENRDQYDAVATVHLMGDEAFICGAHGAMSRQFWRELQEVFEAMGVRKVMAERHGKTRVLWEAAS